MNKIILLFSLLCLPLSAVTWADQVDQVFTLKDGSQIKGELSGINNGVYTVKTPIIGDVHVAVSDVASITNSNAMAALPSPSLATSSSMDQQIAASQQKLMSNPQSMATLQEMMQDPDILQALQDPALVQAVTNHDYQAVQSNPKIQELMNNPKMQVLMQKLSAQQKQGQNSSSQ